MTHDITALDLLPAERPASEAGHLITDEGRTQSGEGCLHDARY